MDLEDIDSSYWLTKDKDWKEERNAQWPAIERVVGLNRNKPEINVIKQYYLRGKMPKWDKYRDWNDIFRPFDLNTFLWLHPSSDIEVLSPLYRTFMESDLVHNLDIILGCGSFQEHEFLRSLLPYQSLEEYPFPYMGEKNIILFRILFGDVDYAKSIIRKRASDIASFDRHARHLFEFLGFEHFQWMRQWLLQNSKLPLSANCLYQYEDVIDWCLTTITKNTEDEFRKGLESSEFIKAYQKALYCINFFDTEREGNTVRSRFVHKIRRILDEREFISEFKQMWLDVKAGKIEVEKPWDR